MNDLIKKEVHQGRGIFAFKLESGEWRALFHAAQFKLLVTEALNATLALNEFKNTVVGYMITAHHVYLVLYIDSKKIRKLFHFFFEQVRDEIRSRYEHQNKHRLKDILHEEGISRDDIFDDLFTQFTLSDEHLIRLITGRNVELPYHDRNLERLKARIHNYKYCSVLDYAGGQSPVLVKVMSKKEWEKAEREHNTNK